MMLRPIRFIKAIQDVFQSVGGHIEGNSLVLTDKTIDLAPLFNYLLKIPHSREFTTLPPLLAGMPGLPLSTMYVELSVSQWKSSPTPGLLQQGETLAKAQEERYRTRTARRVPVESITNGGQHKNIVILGEPGSGKTSLLKRIALMIAKEEQNDLCQFWSFPVFISLRRYWSDKKRNPDYFDTILKYAAYQIVVQGRMPGEYISSMSAVPNVASNEQHQAVEGILHVLSYISDNRMQVLFLLDGMDEISSAPEAVETITREINDLGYGFGWILTSRRAGFFGELTESIRYEVTELLPEGIEKLVANWFSHSPLDKVIAQKRIDHLLSQVFHNPRLLSMARNPFLLTLLCYLQQNNNGDLPVLKHRVYELIINASRELLQHREKNKTLFRLGELDFLSRFCHYLYTDVSQAPRHLFNRDDWEGFDHNAPHPELEKHYLPSRLLDKWGDMEDYHLVHLTLHEYLVARSFFQEKVSTKSILPYLYKPHWRLIIRFYGGMLWEAGRKEDFTHILKALLDPMDKTGLMFLEAASFLNEAGLENSEELLGFDIREKLFEMWKTYQPYISDAAEDCLAVLSPEFSFKKIQETLAKYFEHGGIKAAKPGRDIKTRVFNWLAKIPDSRVEDMLMEIVERDLQDNKAIGAARIAGKRNTPSMRKRLLTLTLSLRNLPIYWEFLFALAKEIGHEDFIPLLEEAFNKRTLTKDDIHTVFPALGRIGGQRGERILLDWLGKNLDNRDVDSDPAITALGDCGGELAKEWFQKQKEGVFLSPNASGILYVGINRGMYGDKDVLELLEESQQHNLIEETTQNLINAIGDTSEEYRSFSTGVAGFLYKHSILAESPLHDVAFCTLAKVEIARASSEGESPYAFYFRKVLMQSDSPEEDRIFAVYLLGQIHDEESLDYLADMFQKKKLPSYMLGPVVGALSHYTKKNEAVDDYLLHLTLAGEDDTIKDAAADSLAKRDFLKLLPFWKTSSSARDSLSRLAAEKGFLIFDDFYVNSTGELVQQKGTKSPATLSSENSPEEITSSSYDLFISYNRKEAKAVIGINASLIKEGIQTFFDTEDLHEKHPSWQRGLEDALKSAKSAMIVIGLHGEGNTQKEEIDYLCSRKSREPSFPFFTLILPGADRKKVEESFQLGNKNIHDFEEMGGIPALLIKVKKICS